jgi:hypothetical protein
MLTDRRRLARTRVAQPAKIVVIDPNAARECLVDNLNTLGACVYVDAQTTEDLPPSFDLTFDNCHTFWSCRVIWRVKGGGRVGVTWKLD